MTCVRAILRLDRTVADLGRTEAFYRDGLGFARVAPPEPLPREEAEALGLGGEILRLRMRLGEQSVAFLAGGSPGSPAAANDPAFQHFAIPVRDMAAAFARVEACGATPISRGGPVLLPPSSGGVVAYKFRDPDGLALELLAFPEGPGAARWSSAPGLFLGIDHSAITVADLPAALAFFTGALGLTLSERGLNRGDEQARLDGLADPVVDVIALEPPEPAPHVELLHYCSPAGSSSGTRGTTRFVFAADDPAGLAEALREAGHSVRLSAGSNACFAAGPDGHGCLFLREG